MHSWIKKEAVEMESRFGAGLSMGTEFLKEGMLNGSAGDVTDSLKPLTHEPCWVIQRSIIVAWVNRDRDKPRLGMLLTTSCQFLAKPNVPVIAKSLETLLALAAWNEQAESSDIPRVLSQVTHWQ